MLPQLPMAMWTHDKLTLDTAKSCCRCCLQVPLLVESYAEQLPALLDPQRALRLSATGGDAGQRDRAV